LLFRAKQDSGVACEGAITKKKRVVLVRKPLKIILMLLLGVSLGLAACTSEPSEPSLIGAAKKGDTETVKTLLAAGADVNAQNWVGQTALMQAAWHGHTAIVEILKEAGARE
jgi:ankyrin repeat protein